MHRQYMILPMKGNNIEQERWHLVGAVMVQ
jgi:hypothetical protein